VFIVSKIIGFLLDPFLWILVLAALYVFVKDDVYKRTLRTTAVLVFLLFSNPYIINNIWDRYQSKPAHLVQGYQTGILLGGMAGHDEMTGEGYFGSAADRFIQAARLYHSGHIKRILVTGGDATFFKKKEHNEADFVAKNLEDLKVPREHILVERKARNTLENASFSKIMLDTAGASSCLLITSAIHMPRAIKIFLRAGIPAQPFPCNYKVLPSDTAFSWRSLIPSGESFSKWTILLKEWAGQIQLAN
jgi:uncharacterized SAM-binding protein YcdF (DUF218 family)